MASLQDQLMKAGLVDEKKAKKANKEKRKQAKVARKSNNAQVDETKQAAQQALAEKAERDRELNRQREEAAQQKAIAAQIKQLISTNAQNTSKGEVAYNFTDGTIKKIYVTPQQQDQLSNGRLAIVKLDDAGNTQYRVVPSPVAAKIAERDDSYVLVLNDKTNTETSSSEEEDWYADYEIPDDLMW